MNSLVLLQSFSLVHHLGATTISVGSADTCLKLGISIAAVQQMLKELESSKEDWIRGLKVEDSRWSRGELKLCLDERLI